MPSSLQVTARRGRSPRRRRRHPVHGHRHPAAYRCLVVKSVSTTTPALGDTVTYTLTVRRDGPSSASDVSVADTPAAGLTLLSATPSQGACGTPDACQIGTLNRGDEEDVTVIAKAGAQGRLGEHRQRPHRQRRTRSDQRQALRQTIDVQPTADLKLVKTASATTVDEGEGFHYTIVVTNAGRRPPRQRPSPISSRPASRCARRRRPAEPALRPTRSSADSATSLRARAPPSRSP